MILESKLGANFAHTFPPCFFPGIYCQQLSKWLFALWQVAGGNQYGLGQQVAF